MGELIGMGIVAAIWLWFIFSKQPDAPTYTASRAKTGHPNAARNDDLERDAQMFAYLERIESRPPVTYHEEYHQHDHHAPAPQRCRFCQASNQPYAPTCTACGAPLY